MEARSFRHWHSVYIGTLGIFINNHSLYISGLGFSKSLWLKGIVETIDGNGCYNEIRFMMLLGNPTPMNNVVNYNFKRRLANHKWGHLNTLKGIVTKKACYVRERENGHVKKLIVIKFDIIIKSCTEQWKSMQVQFHLFYQFGRALLGFERGKHTFAWVV